jgi:hypothetical protein
VGSLSCSFYLITSDSDGEKLDWIWPNSSFTPLAVKAAGCENPLAVLRYVPTQIGGFGSRQAQRHRGFAHLPRAGDKNHFALQIPDHLSGQIAALHRHGQGYGNFLARSIKLTAIFD